VLGIFDFVHALIETPRHRAVMKKYIEQLIYYVFHYMQMTEEQASLFVVHFNLGAQNYQIIPKTILPSNFSFYVFLILASINDFISFIFCCLHL